MGKGKDYELEIKNSINELTTPIVKAHRPDFSGSSVGEVADVMVLWQADRYGDQQPSGHAERHVAYVELKKRQAEEGKRSIVMSGSSDGDSGLDELEGLVNESPPWSDQYLAVKFNNRELIVLDAEKLLGHLSLDKSYPDAERHGARLTPSDSISMVKPTLDNWSSSRSGLPDEQRLLNEIGVGRYYYNE